MIKVSLRSVISRFLLKKLSSEQDFYSCLRIVHQLTPEDVSFGWSQAAGVVETPQRKPFVVFQFEVNSAVFFWCYEEKKPGER